MRERLQQLGFTTIEVKTDDQLPQKTSRSWCELADNQDWEILPPNEQHSASEQAARCYLAVLSLMVLKELQAKLNAAGVKLTLERISAALKDSQFMVEHGTQDDEMVLMQELQSIGEVGITNVVPWAVEIVIALSMCVDLDIRIAHFAINEVEEQRIKRPGGNFGGVLLQLLDESPKLEIVLPDSLEG